VSGVSGAEPQQPATARIVREAGALEAWSFAAAAHAGQVRPANRRDYIHHPEQVAVLVADNGGDDGMIAAALLHDVLEDSEATTEQLTAAFGTDVASLVVALSDDRDDDDYRGRKHRLREQVRAAGGRAAMIYAADKLANAGDLIGAYKEIGEAVAERLPIALDLRIEIWRDDAVMCREELGGTLLVTSLEAELDWLESYRELGSGLEDESR